MQQPHGNSTPISSLCVYAGSGLGERDQYLQVARALGGELAHRGIALIYGGGNIGLMGAMANSALAGGGTVIGIIPQTLADREIAHPGLSELKIVGSMHERKTTSNTRLGHGSQTTSYVNDRNFTTVSTSMTLGRE